jgi:opacity protein-like surface antigen
VAYSEFDSFYQNAGGQLFEQSDGLFGLRIGTGLEVPLSDRIFGRFDYSLTDYRDYEVANANAPDNFDNTELQARFGIGYRFQAIPDGLTNKGAPEPSFSGAYLGTQVGYGTLDTVNSGPRQAGSTLTADRGGYGAGVGIFAGYGYTLGDFFIGAELDGSFSDAGWNIEREPTGRIYSVEKDESFGASARFGYVLPLGTLVYARVGIVRSNFKTKYAFGGSSVDQDDMLTGLRIGGGIETPLTKDLFLRFDYTHTSYDSYSVDYGSGIDAFDHEENVGAVGIAYRF